MMRVFFSFLLLGFISFDAWSSPYPLISTADDLKDVCQVMKQSKHIAVDLEFKKNTLCLIQIAWGQDKEDGILIDYLTLHNNKDRRQRHALGPLVPIFQSNAITKVFHAPSQDLRILYGLTGQFPKNLADTQIMYATITPDLNGMPGYAHMVGDLLGISLDKAEQQSDWTQRPLTQQQLIYASADVSHLYVLYPLLQERLQEVDRSKLIEEVFNNRFQVGNFIQESNTGVRRLLNQVNLHDHNQTERVTSLAHWRRQQAPRRGGRVLCQLLSDQNLVAIA